MTDRIDRAAAVEALERVQRYEMTPQSGFGTTWDELKRDEYGDWLLRDDAIAAIRALPSAEAGEVEAALPPCSCGHPPARHEGDTLTCLDCDCECFTDPSVPTRGGAAESPQRDSDGASDIETPGQTGPGSLPRVCAVCGGSGKTYTSSYGMPREWPCPTCQGGAR